MLSRFLWVIALIVPFVSAQERSRSWEHAREIVDRTMDDLRHIERQNAFAGEDRDRYERAMRSLSDFDRSVSEGRFDRGKLDEAIEHVDHVMKSKMLDPRERDRVMDDLRDLRRLREEWR